MIGRVVRLEPTAIGDAYVEIIKRGPFARFSRSQEDHSEDGLRWWWKNTDPQTIGRTESETSSQGTILHGYFATVVLGKTPIIKHEWAKLPIANFQEFVKKYNVKCRHSEIALVSDTLGLGGQVDLVGTAQIPDSLGDEWIMDWKTGGVHDSYKAQLAVYQYLVNSSGYLPWVENLGICQIHRDGKTKKFVKVEEPWKWLQAALYTFERWKITNYEKLRWACAPTGLVEERKKTRGKNRTKFNNSQWREEYKWPWLERNSLNEVAYYIQELKERSQQCHGKHSEMPKEMEVTSSSSKTVILSKESLEANHTSSIKSSETEPNTKKEAPKKRVVASASK